MSQEDPLATRIEALEQRVLLLEGKARITEAPTLARAPEQPSIPKKPSVLVAWLKEDWLMKLGAFLLILALAWFVRYAFMHNWIGPMGRITLGLLTGVGFIAWGHILMGRKPVPGQVLIATGMVMTLVTVFAARNVYDFFTPLSALAVTSLVVIAVAVIATIRSSYPLAVCCLIGGAVAPLLTNSPEPNEVFFMTYGLALDVGMFIIVAKRGWRSLILISLAVTGCYSFAFEGMPLTSVWIFMALFYVLFFGVSTIAMRQSKQAKTIDLVVVGGISVLLLLWILEYIPEHWQSMVLALAAGLPIITTYYLFGTFERVRQLLYTYAGVAALFLVTATAIELDGSALTIALTVEIFIATYLSQRLFRDTAATTGLTGFYCIPLLRALDNGDFLVLNWINYAGEERISLLNDHFFVLLILILTIGTSGYLLLNTPASPPQRGVLFVARAALGVALICAMSFVWLSMHNVLMTPEYARGTALVLYTMVGIWAFIRGSRMNHLWYRRMGMGLLLFVVAHLLLFEVWQMPIAARIVTFLAIGILLLSTAFITKKKKLK